MDDKHLCSFPLAPFPLIFRDGNASSPYTVLRPLIPPPPPRLLKPFFLLKVPLKVSPSLRFLLPKTSSKAPPSRQLVHPFFPILSPHPLLRKPHLSFFLPQALTFKGVHPFRVPCRSPPPPTPLPPSDKFYTPLLSLLSVRFFTF